MGRSCCPAVGGPGAADEAADDDRGVGKGDESVDDEAAPFGADEKLFEAAVVPGVGALDHPAGARLNRESLLADPRLAAEFVDQITGLSGVVSGVQVDSDRLR